MGIGSKLRERGITQYEIGKAEAILRSARAWMYELTEKEEIWDKAVRDAEITIKDRALLRAACAHTAFEGARAVDIAYTLGGGTSIYDSSILQRCLRDAHTATQHVMHALPNYETAGKALLGLDPGPWCTQVEAGEGRIHRGHRGAQKGSCAVLHVEHSWLRVFDRFRFSGVCVRRLLGDSARSWLRGGRAWRSFGCLIDLIVLGSWRWG